MTLVKCFDCSRLVALDKISMFSGVCFSCSKKRRENPLPPPKVVDLSKVNWGYERQFMLTTWDDEDEES